MTGLIDNTWLNATRAHNASSAQHTGWQQSPPGSSESVLQSTAVNFSDSQTLSISEPVTPQASWGRLLVHSDLQRVVSEGGKEYRHLLAFTQLWV